MNYLSFFTLKLPRSLVYMLQASEYNTGEYFAWLGRGPHMGRVAQRKQLVLTAKAKLLLVIAYGLLALCLAGALLLLWAAIANSSITYAFGALTVVVLSPLLTAYLLPLPLAAGYSLVQKPKEQAIIARAASQLANHPGVRIGIAGSYGKTTCKEMLATILAAGKKVAATPGNMNTPLGISRFIGKLKGNEEVLIFEMGEYYPGDVRLLCELTHPSLGVITGINEAHLSKFKSIDRTVATIFELADYLGDKPVFKNGDNDLVRERAGTSDPLVYSHNGVDGWQVNSVVSTLEGVSFTARKDKVEIKAVSGLLGVHNVGPLVACIAIASRLGLTPKQIEDGVAATTPFEYRMQPRVVAGAHIIDDTYNGNIDGVRAGLAWLRDIKAPRRIYVTPGLVEQGDKTAAIHQEIGRLIAESADVAVLMQNSTTAFIQEGLRQAGFTGTVQIVTDPQRFYTNIAHFVAKGDVVLMQNDWTDNYA